MKENTELLEQPAETATEAAAEALTVPPSSIVLGKQLYLWSALLISAGIATFAYGLYFAPQRAWANFLLGDFYFLSLSLCGTIFLAIHYLSNAGWWVLIKRIPQAITGFLALGGLLLFALYFGRHHLYEWSHEQVVISNPVLQGKALYLNVAFFFVRMVLVLGLWLFLTAKIEKHALSLDRTGDLSRTNVIKIYSAIFLVVYGITFTFASFDWIMSLEPEWYSTIFAIYHFSGLFVSGVAAITIFVIVLKKMGVLAQVNEDHLQDLGKYVFSFSTFWAYIWLSQFLLIWYANIPEEAVYYARRMNTSWHALFLGNLFLNWVIPFLMLMTRKAKRNPRTLLWACIIVLIGHWVDLYLMIMPVVSPEISITLYEPLIFVAFGSIFLLLVLQKFRRLLMIPCKDPYYAESLHFHQ